jgi:hypothetical protein
MGEQTQLDLRVVCGEQHAARRGDEGGANLAPELGADGDVLQVRVGRGETAGGRAHLVEGGVDAAFAVGQQGQGIGIIRLQLGELPVFQHQPRDVVVGGQFLEHVLGGRDYLALAVFHGPRQVHPVEENITKLFGRVDIEAMAGERENLLAEAIHIGQQGA